VVKNDIPLLISKKTMKSLGTKLNFETDTSDINGKSIPLLCSTTGHYSLPLTRWDLQASNSKIVLHAENIGKQGLF